MLSETNMIRMSDDRWHTRFSKFNRLQICRQEQLFTFCYGFFDLSECMCLATLLLVETSAPMTNGLLACVSALH